MKFNYDINTKQNILEVVVMCIFVRYVVALFLFFALVTSHTHAADKYFKSAIEKMIADSDVPIDGYGFDLKHSLTRPGNNGDHNVFLYTFFTKDNNSYLKEMQTDNDRRLESLTVYVDGARDVRKASKTTVGKEFPVYALSTSLGEHCRVLDYYVSKAQNSNPFLQTYQILVNPCYFYLAENILPRDILELHESCVVKQPSEQGCEVYLLKNFIDHYSKPEFLLSFSPAHNDKLVKCVFRNAEGAEKSICVDKWDKVSGRLVASKIQRSIRGVNEETLDISAIRIGGIKDRLFDVAKLPEFKQKWNSVLDYDKLVSGDPNWITHNKSSVEMPNTGRRWLVVVVVNILLISLLMYSFRKKYYQQT